ncbi:siderophore-interacting protein [Chitinimonas sp.]|uniref:siderophore-interacting protein n=1 Tax=Chitinimonas sp. TaxID=1934313 RepID=UPI0035B24B44
MSEVLFPRAVQRIRHELKMRPLTVQRIEDLSPSVRRIVFTGAALSDFVSASFDDHIKLIIEQEGAEPFRRDYTPRAFSRASCELAIEFVLHGTGLASEWASQAQPGQSVVVAGPRGSMVIPTDYDWHLLIGDESALPAIARRLEELPVGNRAMVIAQAGNPADQRALASKAEASVQWVSDGQALHAALRGLTLPEGEGYAWAAGEHAVMTGVRRILIDEKQHSRSAMRVAAYWKQGESNQHGDIEDN